MIRDTFERSTRPGTRREIPHWGIHFSCWQFTSLSLFLLCINTNLYIHFCFVEFVSVYLFIDWSADWFVICCGLSFRMEDPSCLIWIRFRQDERVKRRGGVGWWKLSGYGASFKKASIASGNRWKIDAGIVIFGVFFSIFVYFSNEAEGEEEEAEEEK